MRILAGLFVGHRAVDRVVEHLVQELGVPREHVQRPSESQASISHQSEFQRPARPGPPPRKANPRRGFLPGASDTKPKLSSG